MTNRLSYGAALSKYFPQHLVLKHLMILIIIQLEWEVVVMERGLLSFVSTIEELLEWKSSGFGLENRDYGSGDPLR
jgi:hypothetical protein